MTAKGKKHTEAAKKKMSVARKGIPSPNKGKPMSEQQKKKISDARKGHKMSDAQKREISASLKGKPSGHKGKTHTVEAKKKISDALKDKPAWNKGKKGIPLSEEHKRKMSATRQNKAYDEWESFACEKLYCPKFNEACKEANRAKYGHKCFICGLPQSQNITKTGKFQKLSVHHVDLNKNQGCDGTEWKLVPLCMHHHGGSHDDEIIARLGYLIKEK